MDKTEKLDFSVSIMIKKWDVIKKSILIGSAVCKTYTNT